MSCKIANKHTGLLIPIKKQNQNLTAIKARLIGNLFFDGSVYKSVGYHYSIMYVNSSKKLVERFSRDINLIYGVYPSVFEEEGKNVKIYRVKCNSKLMFHDLLRYTPSYSTSNKSAKIPEEILNGSENIKLEFLRTFWDNEGSIAKNGVIRGSSNSFNIIEQLADLHKELGFCVKIYEDQSKSKKNYILSLKKDFKNLEKFYKYRLFTESIVTRGSFFGMKKIDVLKIFLDKERFI